MQVTLQNSPIFLDLNATSISFLILFISTVHIKSLLCVENRFLMIKNVNTPAQFLLIIPKFNNQIIDLN